jgi:DNA-binding MarR family transcriptional regulator
MPSDPHSRADSAAAIPAARWFGVAEQLSSCGQMLRKRLAWQADACGLTEGQLSALWACLTAPSPGLSQNDLAETLRVSPAYISGLVEQLRHKRLLRGRRDPIDRRRQRWRLTDQGRDTLQAILASATEWACRLDQHLGPGVPERLSDLLGQLTGALQGDSPEVEELHGKSNFPAQGGSPATMPSLARPSRGAAA